MLSKMMNRTLMILAASGLAWAQIAPPRPLATDTQRLDFPDGAALRITGSFGELSIEGWDQPVLELVTLKSARASEDAGKAMLGQIRITTEKETGGAAIVTTVPKQSFLKRKLKGPLPVDVEYRIRVPRTARLTVDHLEGEVHVTNISGDLHITDGKGQITVSLPEQGMYSIDALTKLGAIDSDFSGRQVPKRLKLGHAFLGEGSAGQKLYLRNGYGDITILKASIPQIPASKK